MDCVGHDQRPWPITFLRGNYRPSRHGSLADVSRDRAAALAAATALSPEQQAEREKEIADQMRRIRGKSPAP